MACELDLSKAVLKKRISWGASLVAQWIRIRLPMQGTWVWALVREDPTCRGATKLVHHNYWACALEPARHNYWAHAPQLLSPHATTTEPVRHSYWAHVPQLLSPCATTTEPASHNYWACAPQLLSLCSRAREPQLLSLRTTTTEAVRLEPVLRNKRSPRSPQLEKSLCTAMKT